MQEEALQMEVCDLQNSDQSSKVLEKWLQVKYWEEDDTGNKKWFFSESSKSVYWY